MNPHPIAFFVSRYRDEIERFEAVKWTDKTVTIKGRFTFSGANDREDRSSISSDMGTYFKTEAEAKAHIIARAQSKIDQARVAILNAEQVIKHFSK